MGCAALIKFLKKFIFPSYALVIAAGKLFSAGNDDPTHVSIIVEQGDSVNGSLSTRIDNTSVKDVTDLQESGRRATDGRPYDGHFGAVQNYRSGAMRASAPTTAAAGKGGQRRLPLQASGNTSKNIENQRITSDLKISGSLQHVNITDQGPNRDHKITTQRQRLRF